MSSGMPVDTITSDPTTANVNMISESKAASSIMEQPPQTPQPKVQEKSPLEIYQEDSQDDSQQGSSSQSLDALQDDIFTPTQQLVGLEALQEEERASEKIKQKLRPLSKLNTTRRNIIETINHESTFSQPLPRHFRSGQEIIPDPSIEAMEESHNSHSGIFRTAIGKSIRGRSKAKVEIQDPEEPLPFIEVEPAKLVDAQTELGDRRYFQPPEESKQEGDFVYDFLYQHQRGAFILGTPKFSSKSLLPVDPDEWTDDKFEPSAMDITDFTVPDPTWEWVHKSWLVDMTGDVDEDGWEYAMTFHGSPWHGSYEVFQSFARRRRWIRLRKRKGVTMGKADPLPDRTYPASINSATWTKLDISQGSDDPSPFPPEDPSDENTSDEDAEPYLTLPRKRHEPVDLYKILKKAQSDRKKLAYTAQYVVRYPGQLDELEKRLDQYLNLFDYETSRRKFLLLIAAYSGKKTEAIQKSANLLEFFSDRKAFLN